MEIIILYGRQMTSVEDCHKYIARILRFPSYYGENLDALYDCLSELGSHVHIILTETDLLRTALGDYADRLIAVFRDAAARQDSYKFTAE